MRHNFNKTSTLFAFLLPMLPQTLLVWQNPKTYFAIGFNVENSAKSKKGRSLQNGLLSFKS
jgi:hypothetical protein